MKIYYLILLILIWQKSNAQQIIPKPNFEKVFRDSLNFDFINIIYTSEYENEVKYFENELKKRNIHYSKNQKNEVATKIIFAKSKRKSSKNESYELEINKDIYIKSETNVGIFYGVQSLLQLIGTQKKAISLSQTYIIDSPVYAWRGMHLDVSRHFFGVAVVKKYLDVMAMFKMNTFHWHLTDDQGWRIEIKKYPLLTTIGSERSETMIDKHFEPYLGDGKKYGGFYTQEEIKEVIQYAKERHIEVMPEIEMPGHCAAALSAYPMYSCKKKDIKAMTIWGVSDDVYCVNDSTLNFVYNILDEVMALFPSKYIHIGGDEVPKTRWRNCEVCKSTMKKNKLENEEKLQSYFISKIDSYITSKGKNIIGWDEILEGGLAENAAVMSWRGEEGGTKAANMHHNVVMTPGGYCYFDYYQGNKNTEPMAIGGYTTLKKVYSYNPMPTDVLEENKKYILGAQANLWTEYIATPEHLMYMAMPRMCALSEVLWTNKDIKNYNDFCFRLKNKFPLFDEQNINYSKALFDINANSRSIDNKLYVYLDADINPHEIRYSINDTNLNNISLKYTEPLKINKDETLRAAVYEYNYRLGNIFTQEYKINLATAKKIILDTEPNKSYNTGGANTLVDGIVGVLPWTGKEWLGWCGNDMIATIDLNKLEKINTISISFLEAKESWIHLPQKVEIYTSNDGKKYILFDSFNSDKIKKMIDKSKWITLDKKTNTKFIKVIAKSQKSIPEGNAGAGEKAWLFCSEISIK